MMAHLVFRSPIHRYFGRFALTLLSAFFALWFLMPTVLTITNSFIAA